MASSVRPGSRRKAHGVRRKRAKDRRGNDYLLRGRNGHKPSAGQSRRSTHHPGSHGNSAALLALDHQVRELSSGDLLERFHQLIDCRLCKPLRLMEALELERIEARLDSEEQSDMDRVADYRAAWDKERSDLLASIERLIAALRSE